MLQLYIIDKLYLLLESRINIIINYHHDHEYKLIFTLLYDCRSSFTSAQKIWLKNSRLTLRFIVYILVSIDYKTVLIISN